jgi:hypothetical protein
MTTEDDEQDEPDEHIASSGVHEVFRCARGDETRIYRLLVVPGGAELWRTTESPGTEPQSVKESHLHGPEEASTFLEEIRRSLTAGGWKAV